MFGNTLQYFLFSLLQTKDKLISKRCLFNNCQVNFQVRNLCHVFISSIMFGTFVAHLPFISLFRDIFCTFMVIWSVTYVLMKYLYQKWYLFRFFPPYCCCVSCCKPYRTPIIIHTRDMEYVQFGDPRLKRVRELLERVW